VNQLALRRRLKKQLKVDSRKTAHDTARAMEQLEAAWDKQQTRIDSIIYEYVSFPDIL
jgi:hypothetical protein